MSVLTTGVQLTVDNRRVDPSSSCSVPARFDGPRCLQWHKGCRNMNGATVFFFFFPIENADLLFSKLLVRNGWLGQKYLFGKKLNISKVTSLDVVRSQKLRISSLELGCALTGECWLLCSWLEFKNLFTVLHVLVGTGNCSLGPRCSLVVALLSTCLLDCFIFLWGQCILMGTAAPCTLTNVIAWSGKDRVTSHVWLQATFVAHLGKMVLQMA